MDQVKKYITRATELTAISVSRLIKQQGFTPQDLLEEEESKKREKLIDQAGVDAMYTALTDIPFTLEIVGSEGRKHIHQYGEALPTLMGTLGSGELKLDMVNDVVEGSKAAKLNTEGAVSVVAVSSHKGLMATPDDIDYMEKLFGPPQLKGKISMKKHVEENLAIIMDTFSITADKINVVIMNRERNAHLINEGQKFGVNLILIKAGDLLPAIFCSMDPLKHKKGVYLLAGSGGFEEGILASVAAKALGGVCEGQGWSPDQEIKKKYQNIWSVDELVSGKLEDCLVSVSAITPENKWFDLAGVKEVSGGHEVTTLTVDKSGVNINKQVHH
jgi:fructose-1,6-bisphosphatase II